MGVVHWVAGCWHEALVRHHVLVVRMLHWALVIEVRHLHGVVAEWVVISLHVRIGALLRLFLVAPALLRVLLFARMSALLHFFLLLFLLRFGSLGRGGRCLLLRARSHSLR